VKAGSLNDWYNKNSVLFSIRESYGGSGYYEVKAGSLNDWYN